MAGQGAITGTVRDLAGELVIGATIVATADDGSEVVVISEECGRFQLGALHPGRYTVSVFGDVAPASTQQVVEIRAGVVENLAFVVPPFRGPDEGTVILDQSSASSRAAP